MIAYLKGNVLHINPEYAIIETGGVGYEVFLSGSAYRSLIGKRTGEVYTYYQLKEDGVSLFGFSSLQEKALFLELISVSGVGPKMGIAVLVQLSAEEAIAAISTANLKKLCSVKGLGKKTAERIVLELKDKLSLTRSATPLEEASLPPEEGDDDALAALLSLGFTRQEALAAVEKAKKSGAKGTEAVIMAALKSM